MSCNKDTATGIGLGLAIGAVVGLAIGMLYAPRPGEETREILREKAGEYKHKAAEAIAHGREKAAEVIAKGEEKLAGKKRTSA